MSWTLTNAQEWFILITAAILLLMVVTKGPGSKK